MLLLVGETYMSLVGIDGHTSIVFVSGDLTQFSCSPKLGLKPGVLPCYDLSVAGHLRYLQETGDYGKSWATVVGGQK